MLDQRVFFHYNGHGVPKPTSNGEIWVFNKSYTQYVLLPITDLDSWLKTPIYVFDCSAAGIIVKAFLEGQTRETLANAAVSVLAVHVLHLYLCQTVTISPPWSINFDPAGPLVRCSP